MSELGSITVRGLRRLKLQDSDPSFAQNQEGSTASPTNIGTTTKVIAGNELKSLYDGDLEAMADEFQDQDFERPRWSRITYQPLSIKVIPATDDSCYHITNLNPQLKIREDESPARWWTNHTRVYEDVPVLELEDSLCVFESQIILHQSMRVPDDGRRYDLPPGLDKFPLYQVSFYKDTLPSSITRKGGYITPMYQREALWIGFLHASKADPVAIKVSVGGINAITGLAVHQIAEPGQQDYLCKRQPWLDGIAVEPGVVRQFTAVDINESYTIEEQLTGKNEEATLQFDVFPSYKTNFACRHDQAVLGPHEPLAKSGVSVGSKITLQPNPILFPDDELFLSDLVFCESTHIELEVWPGPGQLIQIFIRNHTGKTFTLAVHENDTVGAVKEMIEEVEGIPLDQIRLIFAGKQLEDDKILSFYRVQNENMLRIVLRLRGGGGGPEPTTSMGIAAGGQIEQEIYKDFHGPDCYAYEHGQRIYVHAINAAAWKAVTGEDPPITSISKEMYENEDIPWFQMYNKPEGLTQFGRGFANVQSVKRFDEQTESSGQATKKQKLDVKTEKDLDFSARWNNQETGVIVLLDAEKVSRPSR